MTDDEHTGADIFNANAVIERRIKTEAWKDIHDILHYYQDFLGEGAYEDLIAFHTHSIEELQVAGVNEDLPIDQRLICLIMLANSAAQTKDIKIAQFVLDQPVIDEVILDIEKKPTEARLSAANDNPLPPCTPFTPK